MSGFAVTSYNPPAVGILSARVESLESARDAGNVDVTLGINSERYQTFLTPCQNIDGFALTNLNSINTNKVSIANSGDGTTYYAAPRTFLDSASATSAINTDYAGIVVNVGVATALRFGASASFTAGQRVAQQNSGAFGTIIVTANSQRVLLTGVGGTGSFNTTDPCSVGIGTTFSLVDSIGIPNQIRFAGLGEINNDAITVSVYPNLEPVNTSVNSPFEGETTQALGAGNTGLGFLNTFSPNGGTFIGTVFAFQSSGAPDESSTITTLRNEITTTLRPGITSFTDTVNIIKPYKNSFAINVWSLSKSNVQNTATIAGLNTAISILSDPQFGGPY